VSDDNKEASSRDDLYEVIIQLRRATCSMTEPMILTVIREFTRDPFIVLVSCILSLRTKDSVSLSASYRLFRVAKTPHDLLKLSLQEIQKLIYPVGFYRRKAQQLRAISTNLVEFFDGKVPQIEQELLNLPGVGRKTANLVLGYGFNIPALCVDTHVHRVANRLGWVKTKTAHETEDALKKIIPKKNWIELNSLLVVWGQNICMPRVPSCSVCAIRPWCLRVGVVKSR